MVSILLVHGRSRPLFGPVEMKQQWILALRSGFEMHLAKPVDPAELVASVATLVRRAAKER